MYKTSGHLPYYAESMFPKMEMDEYREARTNLQARIVELEKQLAHSESYASIRPPASGDLQRPAHPGTN